MDDSYLVHIVDDDSAVRDAIARLVDSVGLKPNCYSSAEEFIDSFDDQLPSVLILDVRMSGMGGLGLQDWLINRGFLVPIIVISGHGDIPMAVEVVKKGAIDFIEKPFRNQSLLDCVQKAILHDTKNRKTHSKTQDLTRMYSLLTDREREVCKYLSKGLRSKIIADKMNVSSRTIEGHRSNILKKMQATSTQELILRLLQLDSLLFHQAN